MGAWFSATGGFAHLLNPRLLLFYPVGVFGFGKPPALRVVKGSPVAILHGNLPDFGIGTANGAGDRRFALSVSVK